MASNLQAVFKTASRNKVIYYIVSRYATYLIQFINSLFIAVYLGPYYLGIWGFITLIIQYLNQINFGIAHSVNAIIAIHKNKEWYVQKVIGTSLTMLLGLSLLIILFFTANTIFRLNLGDKYNFSTYAPAVALIGILGNYNSLFSSIFRVYGRLTEIAVNQSAFPIVMLAAIIIFKGKNLLWALVGANLIAFFISFVLFLIKTPVKLKLNYIGQLLKTIQIKGWHLFVYNTSFYLIIISTRSFVSSYYKIEEFGYFTFAFSLANVIFLLLQSFSYLIYPKILNRFALATTNKTIELLDTIRDAYITTSHLLVHLSILFFPLFIIFFPKYTQAADAFKLIALTIVLYTNSFGYSALVIAKGYEKRLGNISLSALVINIVMAFIFIKVFHVHFSSVILATMITYFFYVFSLGSVGRKTLKIDASILSVFKDIYPLRLFVPYVASLCLIIFSASSFYFVIPPVIFLILNSNALFKIKELLRNIITNPEFINI